MKRYTITVNGVAYDVTVDEANGAAPAAPAKRGRKPAAKEEGAAPAAPAKRGRKPAAKEAEQTEQ